MYHKGDAHRQSGGGTHRRSRLQLYAIVSLTLLATWLALKSLHKNTELTLLDEQVAMSRLQLSQTAQERDRLREARESEAALVQEANRKFDALEAESRERREELAAVRIKLESKEQEVTANANALRDAEKRNDELQRESTEKVQKDRGFEEQLAACQLKATTLESNLIKANTNHDDCQDQLSIAKEAALSREAMLELQPATKEGGGAVESATKQQQSLPPLLSTREKLSDAMENDVLAIASGRRLREPPSSQIKTSAEMPSSTLSSSAVEQQPTALPSRRGGAVVVTGARLQEEDVQPLPPPVDAGELAVDARAAAVDDDLPSAMLEPLM